MRTGSTTALALALTLGLINADAVRCRGQNVDPTRAPVLTVEQATELAARKGSVRIAATELSPEVARALAGFKGELRFDAITALSPEAAAALATCEGNIDLLKLSPLTPPVARALAGHKARMGLAGVKELSPETAEALAAHAGVLDLGVTDLSDAAAAGLAKHSGELRLSALKSLTSLALATRLGRQEWVFLNSVTQVTPDIAAAVCPPENRQKFKNHVQLFIGLTEVSPEVAAVIMAGRGHLSMHALESISDEAAAAWSGPFANIRLFGLKEISPAAVASLAQGGGIFDIRFYGPELSDEAAASLAEVLRSPNHRVVDINGIKKLSSPELAIVALQRPNGGHYSLNGVTEITAAVAAALAACKENINPLPNLATLTSVPLAAKYAAQPGDMVFKKVASLSDDVALALARHKGKIDLSGLQSLSPAAAAAFAARTGELKLDGLREISDDAARSIAKATSPISLKTLDKASPGAIASLKANPMLVLSPQLARP